MSAGSTPADDTRSWLEGGQGRAVVFLHGYPLTREIFRPQLEPISREYHAVLLDLPGYGRAEGQPVPETLAGFADHVHDFLTERFPAPVVLVGHSFGGYIALEMWRRHPERVGALVLTDTRSQPDTPEARQKRLATAKRLEEPGERLDAAEIVRGLLAPATLTGDRRLVDHLQEIVANVPASTVIATLRAIAERPDLTPVLSTIRVPTLVVWGEEDQLIPPSQSQSMVQQISGSVGVGIPRAGHLPSLESPEALSQALDTFLARVGPASSGYSGPEPRGGRYAAPDRHRP